MGPRVQVALADCEGRETGRFEEVPGRRHELVEHPDGGDLRFASAVEQSAPPHAGRLRPIHAGRHDRARTP